MARFAVIDIQNLYMRAARGCQGDAFTRAGMGLHVAFKSFRKMFTDFGCDHLVMCCEGRSWRYRVFKEYKAKRRLDRAAMTMAEREDEEVILYTLNELITFLDEKTRVTVLRSEQAEGDDYVARFIKLHPNDEHVILSSDSDFIQLIDENVTLYDAMLDRIISRDGVMDSKGRELVFSIDPGKGKIKIAGPVEEEKEKHRREQKIAARENPDHVMTEFTWSIDDEWWRRALFIKLVRGDAGDGIFSAFPGVRYAGTKKKVGIAAAWADRHEKGFDWNNFMKQSWDKLTGSDDEGKPITTQVLVEDEIERNRVLIDLTAQPQDVVAEMDATIVERIQRPPVRDVGISLLRFCGKHSLQQVSTEAAFHGQYLNAGYPLDG